MTARAGRVAAPPTGRVLGLDLGTVRIGVAVCDAAQTVASGLTVLPRSGEVSVDHRAVAALALDEGAVAVVVGLPRSLDGSIGPAARAVLEEVRTLRTAMPIPVETCDERLTTVSAGRALRAAGRRGRQARQVIDREAAAIILQSWLDRRRRA